MSKSPFTRVLFIAAAAPNIRNIIDTISCMETVAYTVVVMEETGTAGPCDEAVERTVRDFRPDLVILIPSIRFFDNMPSRRCLELLRRIYRLPIVHIYMDLAKPVWQVVAPNLIVVADYAVGIDGVPLATADPAKMPRWSILWTPVHLPEIGPVARDIDVSLIGSIAAFPHRERYLDHLRRRGITVTTGGGDEQAYRLSVEEYYRLLCRSKIVLCFSRAGVRNFAPDGAVVHHLKGRVMETLACGALLLESKNDVTPRYLVDGEDFASFVDEDDLLAKIELYLANDHERRRIAEHGHRTFTERYTAGIFWETLLREATNAA